MQTTHGERQTHPQPLLSPLVHSKEHIPFYRLFPGKWKDHFLIFLCDFCWVLALCRLCGFSEILFRQLAWSSLHARQREGRLVLRLLSCFQHLTLHVFKAFQPPAFYLVTEDCTVSLQERLTSSTLFSPSPTFRQLLVSFQAADGCSVNRVKEGAHAQW